LTAPGIRVYLPGETLRATGDNGILKDIQRLGSAVAFLLLSGLLCTGSLSATEKLPAKLAGTIGKPSGNIAFIRNKNIWMMRADGSNQMLVCEAGNAEGRLSWGPDGKRIIFTRAGKVNFQSPDNTGGLHKVYDLFIAYPDSAKAGKAYWWTRITEDLGSRYPEWTGRNRIIFTKDMNANRVNAILPNYQICLISPDGSDLQILRKDWQMMGEFFISPSINSRGDVVFVHFYDKTGKGAGKPQGIAVLNEKNFMMSVDSVRMISSRMPDAIGPAWSPDNKWIAYINNSLSEPGVLLTTPDLSKKYLVFEPPPGAYLSTLPPSFSPDSKWLTFGTTDGSVWICDITGTKPRRISGPGLDSSPTWSKAPKK